MKEFDEIVNITSGSQLPDNKSSIKKFLLIFLIVFIVAIFLAIFIRYFIFTPAKVENTSMFPTLNEGDILIASRFPKTVGSSVKRGDIVIFEAPSVSENSTQSSNNLKPTAQYYNSNSNLAYQFLDIGKTTYIKRVVGLPGEKILIKKGKLYINDIEFSNDYIDSTIPVTGPFFNITVPDGTIFVLGDNRTESKDSRNFGCIPIEKIEGKILFRVFPFNKFGKI